MASRGCWKPQLPRTELAEKYGHLLMPIIKDAIPLKSGLTPIILNPHATDSENKFADDVRYIQRRLYSNFTAAELERIEAVAPLYSTYKDGTVVNASADIAIHPVMQRKKWNYPLPKQAAEFPLGRDLDGYWNACTNDIVWEALLPALRIASLYFSNIDMWPWHDALFAAEWTEIPKEEVPRMHLFGRTGYRRFFTRSPFVYGTEAARRNVRNKLLNFSKNIYFSLTSCFVDPTSGVKIIDPSMGSVAGSTITSSIDSICVINLDFRSISALLPGIVEKLNVAERCLIHCDFAITIIHELAHAVYQQECRVSHPDYRGMLKELYFEQEVTSELGISLEQTLFGGITAGIRGPGGKGKIAHLEGGSMAYDINTRYLQGYNGDHPVLLNKSPTFDKCTFWPVPVSWFLNLGSKSKFDFVRKYGLHSARYTRIVGSEFEVDSDGDTAQRDYIRRLGGLKSVPKNGARIYFIATRNHIFSEGESDDFSTYRGSIQLHASSWPRTDLTPLRPKRENFERAERNRLSFVIAVHKLNDVQVGARDTMWPHSTFWDFSAERFLALFNADVKKGNGDTAKLGLGLMSKEELEDMLWHVASTSRFLTWAPKGIIRRLPLTTPEFMEICGGDVKWDEVVLPKGRRLIDWNKGSRALRRWDNTEMETDLEVLEQDTGIKYTDGRVCSLLEYREKLSIKEKADAPPGPPPTEEELEEMAAEKKIEDLIKSVDDYNSKFPNAKEREVFDNAYWPLWTVNNPGKSVDDGFAEYKDCYSMPDDEVEPVCLEEVVANNKNCDTQ